MIGSIRWNLTFGFLSGLLSFLFAAMNNNLLLTSLMRGIISFIAMFMLTFLFRWLLALIMTDVKQDTDERDSGHIGGHIDFTTPDQDVELPQMTAAPGDDQARGDGSPPESDKQFLAFEPLRLTRTEGAGVTENPDPAITAKVIRRLTED